MIAGYPIQIRVGMAGTFHGQKYRVAGLARLGETEYGRIYYWNECYLETDGEQYLSTLVYEETNLGGQWRWFTMYDPANPMTAAEASTKRVGNIVNLDGANLRVTFVNESAVYQTEGRTPEGLKPGARAKYFNAESGAKLQVVSWTGDEVEFFHGMNLSPATVASAFNLRTADLVKYPVLRETSSNNPIAKILTALVVVFGFLLIFNTHCDYSQPPPAVVHYDIYAPTLKVGDSGTLNGATYRVDGHAAVEIAEMGAVTTRHEYLLHDLDGNDALLIYGWKQGAKNWLLFTPLLPGQADLTPQQAGAVKLGQTVSVNGAMVQVDELFRSTVTRSENLNELDSYTGDVRYGFVGKMGANYLLARWSDHGITFRQGAMLKESDVTHAFNLQPAR